MVELRVVDATVVGSNPTPQPMNITHISPLTIRPLRSDFHVVPFGYMWKLSQEHRVNPVGIYTTKVQAIGEGVKQARDGRVSLVMHGRDGRIQRVYSYDDWVWPHD